MICENPAPMGFSKPYKILILRSCGLQLMHDVRHQYRNSAKNKRQQKTTKDKQKKGLACCVGLSMSNVCIRLWLGQNLSIPKNKHILTAGEGNRIPACCNLASINWRRVSRVLTWQLTIGNWQFYYKSLTSIKAILGRIPLLNYLFGVRSCEGVIIWPEVSLLQKRMFFGFSVSSPTAQLPAGSPHSTLLP